MHIALDLEFKMFYKILGADITNINLTDSFVIGISNDGSQVMISSITEPTNIEILDSFDNNDTVTALLNTDFWKQPCINCNSNN